MRVGILTLPPYNNYGGILQAWALKNILETNGHTVKIFVHLIPKAHNWIVMPMVWVKRLIGKFFGKKSIPIFSEIKNTRLLKKRYGKVLDFVKKNLNCHGISGVEDITQKKYDLIIVGSDQIWRKKYIEYLWGFEDPSNAFLYNCKANIHKIAYGASFGVDNWEYNEYETNRIKKALQDFNFISVREESGRTLLKNEFGINAKWVLDPTMLLNAQDYEDAFGLSKTNLDKIVSYILDASSEKTKIIKDIKAIRNKECEELNQLPMLSIREWINHIRNADMVITDSFHGCVFSIIFRKPLAIFLNSERGNTRFDTLIQKFGLQNNIIHSYESFNRNFDYCLPRDIHEKLNIYRDDSMKNLMKVVNRL